MEINSSGPGKDPYLSLELDTLLALVSIQFLSNAGNCRYIELSGRTTKETQ